MSAFEIFGPAVGTLAKIEDKLLGASAASFDFQSIPASYTHLLLVLAARIDTAVAASTIQMRMNNDSGTSYSSNGVGVTNTTVAGVSNASVTAMDIGLVTGASAPTSRFSADLILLPDYAVTAHHKSAISLTSALGDTGVTISTGSFFRGQAGIWNDTAAITRLTIVSGAANFITGSRATLYGLGI